MEVIFVMSESNKYIISVEVLKYPYFLKYPYCGKSIESEEFLSEKICCSTIKVRKKIIKKAKWLIVYGDFVLRLTNGVVPSQAIGLAIPPQTPAIMRSIHSNADLSKQAIIAQVIQQMPAEIDFTQKEMNELYHLSVECKNNSLSQEELITKITNLRGGSFVDVAAGLAIIAAIIILANNANGFQPNPHVNVPPHLQWLYGNNYQPGQFGYGKGVGPRSITVTGMTQNAGSEKKYPSSGSWDYKEIMRELDRQSSKKRIDVQVGDQIYILKNPYHEGPYELGDKLADQIYESIRESDTDICDIAQNLGFKADNIKNVKDHVFYNEHDLDRYGPDQIERKQFDPNLQQALAWKRLENGTHTQDDVTWIKHECAERHHELKYGSGYNEAHNRAQTRFDGAPWENQF
jgi:hypothetical protein